MNVRFISRDPRGRARPDLDQVLARGTARIAIACAFLTRAGVELLRPHTARLKSPGSFVVVAWEPPTSLDAVQALYELIGDNLRIHLGDKTPEERGGGRGLMHSKVFYAEGGERSWLWTGSHNLTGAASQGVNCEAAILLEGGRHEQPFLDAIAHLSQCYAEAIPFREEALPPLGADDDTTPTVVIHAEGQALTRLLPWFLHLRLPTESYDKLLAPPANAWLYLYPLGSLSALRPGSPRPNPQKAYSGSVTALNFTERHPKHPGIPADWRQASGVIEPQGTIFALRQPPGIAVAVSQCVINLEAEEDPRTRWFKKKPSADEELVVAEGEGLGLEKILPVDPDLLRFFTRASVQGTSLLRQPYAARRFVLRVPSWELGAVEPEFLRNEMRLSPGVVIEVLQADDRDQDFIYRARYQLKLNAPTSLEQRSPPQTEG